ncbi:MAG: response regulator [Kordiimonadaceae bacterium]|nr:response regulator [Kordiimonadaceae bacterium]
MTTSTDIYGRRCILVVEDNPVLAGILGQILEKMRIVHHIVPDGLEAIEICRGREYDLILMGIMLRRMDGMRATREIRRISEHCAKVPIIAVSGKICEHKEPDFIAAGMSDVIKMPINAVNLLDIISKYIGDNDDIGVTADDRETLLQGTDAGDDEGLDSINWEVHAVYRSVLKEEFLPLLEDFLSAGPEVLEDIRAAIRLKEAKQVQFAAHKFKSTSLVFGAETVSNLSAQLEIIGRSGSLDHISPLFEELVLQFKITRAVLQKQVTLMRVAS